MDSLNVRHVAGLMELFSGYTYHDAFKVSFLLAEIIGIDRMMPERPSTNLAR